MNINNWTANPLDKQSVDYLISNFTNMIKHIGFVVSYYEWSELDGNFKEPKNIHAFFIPSEQKEEQGFTHSDKGDILLSSSELFNLGIAPSKKDKIELLSLEYRFITEPFFYSQSNQQVDVLKNSLVVRVGIISKQFYREESFL